VNTIPFEGISLPFVRGFESPDHLLFKQNNSRLNSKKCTGFIMNNIFIPNPSSTLLDIQDAIDDKQQKIETLLELLLIAKSSDCKPEYKLIYEILYMITDFYDEIHNLEDFKKD